MLLDLTLSNLIGQNKDWTYFSTQPPQNWNSIGNYPCITFI